MQQQLRGSGSAPGGGDNNNHGGNAPSGSYSQVSSTTESLDVRQSPTGAVSPARSARSRQETPPGHSPLVLSVSQVQTSNGLLILNSSGGAPTHHQHPHLDPVTGHMIHPGGGTTHHLSHLSAYPPQPPHPPPQPRSDSEAVSSAVRSLNSLSDFTLDVSNGNYGGGGGDPYPPPPIVNDTMLGKGHEGGKEGLLDFKPGLAEMEGKPGELG